MTDPNVLGGDKYGLKFLFESGNTRIVHLFRSYGMGSVTNDFPNELLSLQEANSGLEGSAYSVPVGKKFYMLAFYCQVDGSTDIEISIQRNSTIDNQALGDNLWQGVWEMSTDAGMRGEQVVGGLQFNAGDYITPYNLNGAGHANWAFNCWGVECDA